ncbi:MAG: divalent-cation tolerance protein CutA [archaeon]
MGFIIIKTTYPSKEKTGEVVSRLIEKKLIASANIVHVRSVSAWTGKITEGDEFMVLLNTREENWDAVKIEIEKDHPYEVPCIVKIDAEANGDYEDWVRKSSQKT